MNLNIFKTSNLYDAVKGLFEQLGIRLNSTTTQALTASDVLKEFYKEKEPFTSIQQVYFAGLIDNGIFQNSLFEGYTLDEANEQANRSYDGLMLFAVKLDKYPTRTDISELTRAFNRISRQMPVGLLLNYEIDGQNAISLALSERFLYKQAWREGEKVGKVIILRDILVDNTHSGHLRILQDLVKPAGITTYNELHTRWLEVLDVNVLNKRFFQELSNWYFWAMGKVQFPDDKEKNDEMRNATNLIRLITRIVFIWFIKEKGLVPEKLFDAKLISKWLKDFNKDEQAHNYYHAILQNLFFGTLNQKMGEDRKFAKDGGNIRTNVNEYGVKNVYRYAHLFTISEQEAQDLFKDVPFLNGGLFDCLDKENEEGRVEYVDGFSRNPKKQAIIPDYLFFGTEQEVDLNSVYDTKGKNYKAKGLIPLLNSYKFTIAENTPLEEDVALDPELLGKVFENLLASYNPETKTTARKQTGSFYTPREIVNYMVDESLKAYIRNCLNQDSNKINEIDKIIDYLFSDNLDNLVNLDKIVVRDIMKALNDCKILDPACGSGAFPMGILHRMVFILQKLDPDNHEWRKLQEEKAGKDANDAFKIENQNEREERLKEISDVFENNSSDYGRKLYLIENCIFGVDIQPIAVQISKLRFFISLIIDQKTDKTKDNFGIRSLPNLETKFVAANTLIGLEKENSLFRTPDIINKENELRQIRHEYFTANNRSKKLKLQEKDKKLRKELSEALADLGYSKSTADNIAKLDLFDQNKYENWFDPEWMFGQTQGFDIVIGNPPYKQVSKGLFSKEQFPYSEGKDKGKQNLYKVFVEASYNLTKKDGIATMIVQSSLMCDLSSQFTRELLLTKTEIDEIVEFPKVAQNREGQVFESVLQGTCIYRFNHKIPDNSKTFKVSIGNDVTTINSMECETILQNKILEFYPNGYFIPLINPNEFEIISKMQKVSVPLKKIMAEISQGDLNLTISKDFIVIDKTNTKLLRGRNISKFNIDYSVDEFIKEGFKKESVKRNNNNIFLVCQEVTGTVDKWRLHFAITNKDESFLFGHTANKILLKNQNENFIVLGILNSKLLDWYFRKTSSNNHVGGYEIEQLPIIIPENQQPIINLVDNQIFLKNKNNKEITDTVSNEIIANYLERVIDACVYELYFEEEIKSSNTDVLSLLQETLARLSKLPIEQQINQLYCELNDYKNEIRNRIILQETRSESVATIIKSTN